MWSSDVVAYPPPDFMSCAFQDASLLTMVVKSVYVSYYRLPVRSSGILVISL